MSKPSTHIAVISATKIASLNIQALQTIEKRVSILVIDSNLCVLELA